MKYVKLAMVFAAFAVAAFAATAAQAETLKFLGTLPNAFKSTSGAAKFQNLESALEIECTSGEGEGEVVNETSGKLTKELFLGCKGKFAGISVGECKSGTTAGDIQVSGTTGLGFKLGTALEPLVVLTISPVEIKCPGNTVNVKGCLLLESTLAKSTTATLTAATTGTAGDQKNTDYQTKESGEMKTCGLESSLNGGAFKPSSQTQKATLTFATALELDD
jgi:hypothetical protein